MKNYILLLLFVAATFSACFTMHRAEQQTQKALIKYPVIVAKIARGAFPCILVKSDTIFKVVDTTIWIECPTSNDPIAIINDNTTLVNDSSIMFTHAHNRVYKVPVTLPMRTITITKTIEDSAKIELLLSYVESQNLEVEKLTKINASSKDQVASLEAVIKSKNRLILILSILNALPILFFILKKLYKLR